MHEIIYVADAGLPLPGAQRAIANPESAAATGPVLVAGYYFVLWPKRLSRRWRKRYFGPFPTLAQARMLEESALVLGIADRANVIAPTKPITEQRPAHQLAMAAGGSWFVPHSGDAAACVA